MGCTSGTQAKPPAAKNETQETQVKEGVIRKCCPLTSNKSQRLRELVMSKGAGPLYDELVLRLQAVPRNGDHYTTEWAARVVREFADRFEYVGIGLFFCAHLDLDPIVEDQWFEFADYSIDPHYDAPDQVVADRSSPTRFPKPPRNDAWWKTSGDGKYVCDVPQSDVSEVSTECSVSQLELQE